MPEWWRGQEPVPIPSLSGVVEFRGRISTVDIQDATPHEITGLRSVGFRSASVDSVEIAMDELSFSATWSEFIACTFTQQKRRLNPSGFDPQGSFGNRPSIYRDCHFRGVRFKTLGGFSPGQTMFENCVFDRCRFAGVYALGAEFLRCTFVGRIQSIQFVVDAPDGQHFRIEGNDFSRATFGSPVGFSAGFDFEAQAWPDGWLSDRESRESRK